MSVGRDLFAKIVFFGKSGPWMQTQLKGTHSICFEGSFYPWLLTCEMSRSLKKYVYDKIRTELTGQEILAAAGGQSQAFSRLS